MGLIKNHSLAIEQDDYFAGKHANFKTEITQALIRVFIGILAISVTLMSFFHLPQIYSLLFFPALFAFHGLISLSIASYLKNKWLKDETFKSDKKLANPEKRYWFNLILDQILITACLIKVGDPMIIFLGVYAWFPLDYGLRYGRKFLIPSAILSLIGIMILMYGPFAWADFNLIGFGLIVTILVTLGHAGRYLTAMKQANIELATLASKDPLTNLPNRRYFMRRLIQSMKATIRNDAYLGCVFIDLDGFKKVNDTHGHSIGDALLIQIGKQLTDCLRETDMVARLGGDEFAIMAQYFSIPTDINFMCQRILQAIKSIESIEGYPIKVSASIGVGLYKETTHHLMDDINLIRCADNAMYQAKQNGKDGVWISVGGDKPIELNVWVCSQEAKLKGASLAKSSNINLGQLNIQGTAS